MKIEICGSQLDLFPQSFFNSQFRFDSINIVCHLIVRSFAHASKVQLILCDQFIIISIGTKSYWYPTIITCENLEQGWPSDKNRVICLYLLTVMKNIIIKLCCYMIPSTRSPEGSLWPPGWPVADSPREIWWTVSRNYTVLFLSLDVKNTKFNQYLPVDLTSLNVSNSRFWKPVMFRRWCRHGVALWRHGCGAWHNYLLLATDSNVNCWAYIAIHVTWLWQPGDTENSERRITG